MKHLLKKTGIGIQATEKQLLHLIKGDTTTTTVFFLVDENTKQYCFPLVKAILPKAITYQLIEIKSGEENKNLNSCSYIWEQLASFGADRNSVLINLGGGVICDLGGFAAATYKRGIKFYNIPTTLLAMVDASIGGKTGIDFMGLKNQIGLFADPAFTIIDPVYLNTLPPEALMSGFAEVIKHALIADKNLWQYLLSHTLIDAPVIDKLLTKSLAIKSNIVALDPLELNQRKGLNFGHTIGHAVESYYLNNLKNPIPHGFAIALGIICESYLSYKKKKLSGTALDQITSFIVPNYPLITLEENAINTLLTYVRHDKKNVNGNNKFTLLNAIGEFLINQTCTEKQIIESFKFYTDCYGKKRS